MVCKAILHNSSKVVKFLSSKHAQVCCVLSAVSKRSCTCFVLFRRERAASLNSVARPRTAAHARAPQQ